MLLNLITLYFAISTGVTIYIGLNIYNKSRAMHIRLVGVECFLIAFYVFGYMMELHAQNLSDAIFWNYLEYLSIPFLSSLWVYMSLMYTGVVRKIKDWRAVLIFFIPCVSFILRFTSHWHSLFYASYEMNTVSGIHLMILGKGIWYKVQSVYIVITSALIIIIFLRAYINGKQSERAKYRLLFIASMIPIIMELIIYSFVGEMGLDPAPFVFPIVISIIAYSVFRYDLLDIKTLARDQLFESSGSGVLILDKNMKIMDYNRNAYNFFKKHGLMLEENYLKDYSEEEPDLVQALLNDSMNVYIYKNNDADEFWEIETKIITNLKNEMYGYLKNVREVTEEVKIKQQLEIMAKTDELSQLNNRREFIVQGRRIFEESLQNNTEISLMILDIDLFKRINDTFGHQSGDEVIRQMGKLLETQFSKDLVARIGGEEFAAIMSGISFEKAYERVDEFRQFVSDNIILDENKYRVTISAGIAQCKDCKNLDGLMRCADTALYQAKSMGRNKVIQYKE